MVRRCKLSPASVDILVLVTFWLIGLLITQPVGNFPLNDDWSFARAVERLLQQGEFRPSGWTGMTLITQVLWGALFCLPTGFSFGALRVSTLTLSIVGVIGLYVLLRRLNSPRWFAVGAGLTLAFNPVYHVLSTTFMTDVPFTVLLVWTVYFFVRHLQEGADRDLTIATLLAVVAVLCRQVALIAPVAFAAAALLLNGCGKRTLLRAIIPAAVTAATLGLFQSWLASSGRLPHLYYEKTSKLYDIIHYPLFAVDNLLRNSWIELLYLGLFLLPALLVCHLQRERPALSKSDLAAFAAGVGFALYSLVRLVRLGQTLPLQKSIIVKEGIGPLSLYDTMLLRLPNLPPLSDGFWIAVTGLSVVGGALLVRSLLLLLLDLFPAVRLKTLGRDQGVTLFFLLFTAAYLLPFLTTEISDRYLLPVIPGLLACLGTALPQSGKPAGMFRSLLAGGLLLGFFLFATVGARDYFSWNQARWSLIGSVARSGQVSPQEMDGGFEFNGYFLYDPSYVLKPGMSWWWVHDNRFIIAFGAVPGWTTIAEQGYRHWLPPFKKSMLLLERQQ